MSWDDLRFVLAVVRAGTLTAAARELGVVRTTVGRRIRALEESLGVRLFSETPLGLVPTGAGQELAASAEEMEALALTVEARVAGRDAELRGPLRVATLDMIYDAFPQVFDAFRMAYPGIQLSLLTSDDAVSLRRREADVALRLSDAPPETLVGRRLARVAFPVYAARKLVERIGRHTPLDAYPWLRFDAREDGRGLEPWYRQHASGAPVAMGFDSYALMRRAVLEGVGAHFLAGFDAARDEGLVCLGPTHDVPTRELWVLTTPELRTNSRVRAFLEHLDTALRPSLVA